MDVVSTDMPQILRLLVALFIVFSLMGVLAFLLKKLGLATDSTIRSGDKKRLRIIESIPLDARRRLVIVKCDQKEHLVVLGANSETVIDTNIEPVDDSQDSASST